MQQRTCHCTNRNRVRANARWLCTACNGTVHQRASHCTVSKLIRLPYADEAEEIHRLVAAIKRDKSISKATVEIADGAEAAAKAVAEDLASTTKLEQQVNETRHARDEIGRAHV